MNIQVTDDASTSWTEFVKEGEKVRAIVIEVNSETQKVSLGLQHSLFSDEILSSPDIKETINSDDDLDGSEVDVEESRELDGTQSESDDDINFESSGAGLDDTGDESIEVRPPLIASRSIANLIWYS